MVALAGGVFWAIWTGRLRHYAAAAALGIVVVADLWSIDRRFFDFKPPASELFADDAITAKLRQEPKPFRVLDAGVYPGSVLMAYSVQTVLGYHGNEVRFYDDLLGGKNEWRNLGNPNLHDLLAVRYLLLPDSQAVPGFHPVSGPTPTRHGSTGILYQRDTIPDYVRVVPAAAKLPEDQVVPTVIDPRFPAERRRAVLGYRLRLARADPGRRPRHHGGAGDAHRVAAGKHADRARRERHPAAGTCW